MEIRRNFFMERVVRRWWRCPRKGWSWHSVLWAADKLGMGHRLDLMILELFSNFYDSVNCG